MSQDEQQKAGWKEPPALQDKQQQKIGGWYRSPNALTIDQLRALKTSASDTEPEADIGTTPATSGAWYRPVQPDDAPPIPEPVNQTSQLEAYIASINPENIGEFDASRSGALQGIQPDLGQFDQSRSGSLAGIGAEPEVTFDDSQSGELEGIGATEPDLGAFDDQKSGQLAGLGAEPESTFDDSQSGQMAGIGAEPDVEESITDPQAQNNQASDGATKIIPEPEPDPYAQAEQQVQVLRQQLQAGQITEQQFEDQLRKMMVYGDDGHWWVLGRETNTWYKNEGDSWIPADPPRPQGGQSGAGASTSTSPQQLGATAASYDDGSPLPNTSGIELDSDGMPLPQRVPVDDPEATVVNQSAVNLDEYRSFEAPTHENLDMQPNADATVPSIPHPGGVDGSEGLAGEVAGVEGADPFAAGGVDGMHPPASETNPYHQEQQKMQGVQPDYSEAFGGYWDRATLQKWGLRTVIFGGLGILLLGLFISLGLVGYYLSIVNKYDDRIEALNAQVSDFETTIIYDAAGNEIASFNDPNAGQRVSVPIEEISPFLIHATIATEDETFYQNPGFSVYGIIRASIRNIQTDGGGGGASTITQQLARAIVLDPEFASQRSVERKIEEIIVAAEISRQYSKSEILEFYLNEIYYGNLAYGIEAASQTYFNKSAADLNIAESAFLAGLPQSPATYDPVLYRNIAVLRMEDVLRLMTEANGDGCLQMEHGAYATAPFCVSPEQLTNDYVLDIAQVQVANFEAPSFDFQYPHFVNYIWQQLEQDYGSQRIYTSGFRVYTTIVPSIQNTAQQAVIDEIPITPGSNNGAVVAIRPRDGAVLAMVGSANFDDDEIDGQVNVLFTPQQPGSSIKPLVYLTAIEGINQDSYWYPGTVIWDVPVDYSGYIPRNFSGTFNGPVSMRFALGQSLNIPAVKALDYVTLDAFQQTLDRLQVETPLQDVADVGLPASLGGIEITPFSMARAYATLANGGVQQEPYGIASIINKDGETIYEANTSPEGAQIVSPEAAYLITDILSDSSVKVSTTLNIPGWRAAAKTGTTNDNRDVWTIGYTTEVAVAVWVGRTDNQPMSSSVLGSNTAGPIWNKTMVAALAGLSATDFARPSGIVEYNVCPDTGAQFATETCPSASPRVEVAMANQPPPTNGFITTIQVDSFTGLVANEFCTDFIVDRSYINIDDASAVAWLNTNPAGQTWAQNRTIELPVQAPPTDACTQDTPSPTLIVASPAANQSVNSMTIIEGAIDAPGFQSYEFQVSNADVAPTDFSGALGQVYPNPQPQAGSILGTVDFSQFPNGNYILRVVLRGQDDAVANYDIPVQVNNNAAPPPTEAPPPAEVLPTSTPAPTLTPIPNAEGGDTTIDNNSNEGEAPDSGEGGQINAQPPAPAIPSATPNQ